MDIYSIFMLTAITIYYFNKKVIKNSFNEKNKKAYCVAMGFLLFLISALRSSSVGVDSVQYSHIFYRVLNMPFENIYTNYPKETWFYIFVKLLTYLSDDHQILYAAIGAIYAFAISRFIYKYSKNCMISFIMLIPMMYFAFTLTGLRQTVAISILLISIDFIVQRKFWKFAVAIWIASNFHQSALLFIPAYFLVSKEITNISVIIYTIAAPVIFAFRGTIAGIIQKFLYSGYNVATEGQNAGGWTTLLVYILILFAATLFKSVSSQQYKHFPFFYTMMYVGMCVQMFVPMQPNIFRVSMYYNIASIILIPSVISAQKETNIRIIAYIIVFALMGIEYYMFTFYAARANPYSFFWQ